MNSLSVTNNVPHAPPGELALPNLEATVAPHQLSERFKATCPQTGTEEFRSTITRIISTLDTFKPPAPGKGDPVKATQKALDGVKGKIVGLGKQSDAGNHTLREHAFKCIEEAMPPRIIDPTPEQRLFNKALLDFFPNKHWKETAPHGSAESSRAQFLDSAPASEYVRFLQMNLPQATSKNWNAVNLVTALFLLSKNVPQWPFNAATLPLAHHFVERLTEASRREAFSAQSVCNLVECSPLLFQGITRSYVKDSELERRLINTLIRAIEYVPELPEIEYVRKAFVYPLRHLNSSSLSDRGGAHLCSYVAAVHQLIAKVPKTDTLEITAMMFHSLNGITSWATTGATDAILESILIRLNDRLTGNCESFNSVTAGSIIYGLRAFDVQTLSPQVCRQIQRTLTIVTDKVLNMPPATQLNVQAISSMMHGLTLCLSLEQGPLVDASKKLLTAVTSRMNPEVKTLQDFGHLCGALIPLRRHSPLHHETIKILLDELDHAPVKYLAMDRHNEGTHVSWQNIHQAYALFDKVVPPALTEKLSVIEPHVLSTTEKSRSENRIAEWIREMPGVQLLPYSFDNGFDLDVPIVIEGQRVDIEIDGSHHKQPVQRVRDELRDSHLSNNRGWLIVRIPSDANRALVTHTIENLRKELAEQNNSGSVA